MHRAGAGRNFDGLRLSGSSGRLYSLSFLAELCNYSDTFSADETDEIIKVPLQWFSDHEPLRRTAKILTVPEEPFPYELIPQGRDYRWREGRYEVLFYQYEGWVIWGMTAKIMKSCVELLQEEGILYG